MNAVRSSLRSSALAGQWPADDIPVLRSRPLRSGGDARFGSRYGDAVWRLVDAHPDAHTQVNGLQWRRYPPELVGAFKPFFLAMLDHPVPNTQVSEQPLEYLSVATISLLFRDVRVLAEWMDQHGLALPSQVTDAYLDAYHRHVLALERTAARKSRLLRAVQLLWLFREHLPEPCRLPSGQPWGGASALSLAKAPLRGRINKTPRIAPDTMDALLAWSLRMVEDIGPDIRDAWNEYRQLSRAQHPSQAAFAGLTTGQRLTLLLERLRRDGGALPGHTRGDYTVLNACHLMRLLGRYDRSTGTVLAPAHARRVADSGIPIADDTYIGSISGSVNGRPWRARPITLPEITNLVAMLYAACFTALCYLSGMRPGEALNLRRGCREVDPVTGELLVIGQAGKGHDRQPDHAAQVRRWTVVAPVHTAIEMLESLGDQPLLFDANTLRTSPTRVGAFHARAVRSLNDDIDRLITWVNTDYTNADGTVPIPADPTKHIHASRYRRTLAYFIVRRPRGLIAAALQYGHVATKVTLSYAGDADTSWMDDIAVERLEMVLDQIGEDRAAATAGEHVSGPAADEYRRRLERAAPFAGRVVTTVRGVERLLARADPAIHHGEAMTCVWRAETAACRRAKLEMGLPADDAPDESECRSNCQNLAYTDRDVALVRERLVVLAQAADDPLAPRPRRDRAAAKAEQLRVIVARHYSSQTADPDGSEAA